MLSKKWRKLPLNEDKKASLETEEEKNEEKNKKEIIIVDINFDDKSEPIREEKKELNNNSKEEININSFHLLKKPQLILKVDPNSIQSTKYKIENSFKPNNSYNIYNIEEIKKRYNPRKSYDYMYTKNNNENRTYQINDSRPSFEEIKNKYIKKENKISKDPKDSKSYNYILGTYRNNLNCSLNNNDDNPIYKISNPYNEPKIYYMHTKNTCMPLSSPNTITNNMKKDSYIVNKDNLKREYPNLYYFNNTTRNNNINNIIDDYNKARDEKKNIRKYYSVERPNSSNYNDNFKRIGFNSLKDNLNSSNINNGFDNNRSLINRRNYSTLDVKRNRNDNNTISYNYNENNLNRLLLNTYNNNQRLSYIINDIDNLCQYYPSYNQKNNFSGRSFYSKYNLKKL